LPNKYAWFLNTSSLFSQTLSLANSVINSALIPFNFNCENNSESIPVIFPDGNYSNSKTGIGN
jgi:hypothetical protein